MIPRQLTRAIPRLVALAAVTLAVALPAAAEDITVISKVTASRGPSGTQTLYIAGDMMRSNDGENDTIVDYATGTITFVDHKKKRYWQTTPDEMGAQFEELSTMLEQNPVLSRMFGKAAEARVEKLGARTVAGHDCDDYRVSVGEAYSFDVCAAKDLQPDIDVHAARRLFAATMGPMAGKMSKLFDELAKIQGLALASTMKINVMGANIAVTTEATEVKVGDLAGDVFALPAGYKTAKSPFAK
ncbi:MAG TPA: DUF4412 domain-containing protein [Thermoanaerobaculia bacterium]|nr:DUF4412 domain-containing protein [Thermoanaerobaculia bacterium]